MPPYPPEEVAIDDLPPPAIELLSPDNLVKESGDEKKQGTIPSDSIFTVTK